MRTIHNYKLGKESWDAQREAGRYNPATELHYRDKTGKHAVTLACGDSDDVTILRDGHTTYALSLNTGLGYAGLQAFDNGAETGSVFLQNDYEVDEILGKGGLNKSSTWICKVLSQYID